MVATEGALQRSTPARLKRDETLAILHDIDGLSYRQIQKKTGVSISTISRALNDEDIKGLIEDASKAQVCMLPAAVDRHRHLIDSDNEGVALKAIQTTYTNSSVSPTHTQPRVIQNILIAEQSILDPTVLAILKAHFTQPQAIDITPNTDDTRNTEGSD